MQYLFSYLTMNLVNIHTNFLTTSCMFIFAQRMYNIKKICKHHLGLTEITQHHQK